MNQLAIDKSNLMYFRFGPIIAHHKLSSDFTSELIIMDSFSSKFDIGSTNTFYGYRDSNTTYTMDSNDGSNAQTAFLTDPYVFELVL